MDQSGILQSMDLKRSLRDSQLSADYARVLDWHPFTNMAFDLVGEAYFLPHGVAQVRDSKGCIHVVKSCHIFSDGSEVSGEASWAIVVLVQSTIGTFFRIGFAGGYVETEASHPLYIGASAATSFTGEVCALIWALSLSNNLPAGIPVTVHYDCMSAAYITSQQRSSKTELLLTSVAQAAFTIAGSRRPCM